MDNNKRRSISTPYLRPTITMPTSLPAENLLTGLGETPGPMTLISNFFRDNDAESGSPSFSQLLAGVMPSPAAQPTNLVGTPGYMFMVPPGLSPAILLDSPGQGVFGMSHQQALAQVTEQAAHMQPKATTHHRVPPPMPHTNATKPSPGVSSFSSHSNPPLVAADKPAEDGYNWRKYGQKHVKGSEYPRSYYKCTHQTCPVKKKVERSFDGVVTEIIYKGKHNHQQPRSVGMSKESEPFKGQTRDFLDSREEATTMKDQESIIEGSSDNDDINDFTKPQAKKRYVEVKGFDPVSSHGTHPDSRIVVQATSIIDLLEDGYKWRKYGQKVVKGNCHPRSYYKCTSKGCNVRKHVERLASDPTAVTTTYEGKHNHLAPVSRNNSHETSMEITSRQDSIGLLRLKEEQ